MKFRLRLLITAAFVCHLLLRPPLVTSQLLSSSAQPVLAPKEQPQAYEDVTWRAITQELVGPVIKLHGKAQIHYGTFILKANEMTYNRDTGEATVDGNVLLDGGPNDEHISASGGTYNIESENGHFENVRGTIGMRLKGQRLILTSPTPFVFSGKSVRKTGPDHYVVYDGTITTCELPRPKWQFYAHKVVVEVGGNASIYRSTFRIDGIPILYLPFATHPIERAPRHSGFLVPNIGRSSTKGNILGESVFWAIDRSMDATLGAEYFSRRGWAPQGNFRARPSDNSFVDLSFFSVLDRGLNGVDQSGAEVRLDAEGSFAHNFRGVANIDYLSSFVFRLAFNDVFTQAVNSEVKSRAFLSNATRGFFYNASVQRYQNFESTTLGDSITILHAPGVELSSVDHQIAKSPFFWSYDGAAGGLSRSEPTFRTAPIVGRFDAAPNLSLPLKFDGWSLRSELGIRDTLYTQQLLPIGQVGTPKSSVIDRKALEGSVELLPPPLEKVFDREVLGRKWKHVIEPRIVYNYVTGINDFPRIIRFDERDVLSDTNEVEYSVVNRLYSRSSSTKEDCETEGMTTLMVGGPETPSSVPWEREKPEREKSSEETCQSQQTREVVTWELAQKYFLDPTFGGALVDGRPNVFSTTLDLTGISFLTAPRHLSPLISRLRIQNSQRSDLEWDFDYDFKQRRINTSTALLNYRFGQFTVGGGDAFLQTASGIQVAQVNTAAVTSSASSEQTFNQFRVLLGYGHVGKRGFSGATSIGFDANLNALQYGSIQTAYNWDCCGVDLEYRRFALGSVRNENQFRFTFALANIGAFGNLKRQERLF
ncbi:MAG: LPS-assembly protein LptD [Terriglobales bacterium]